MCMGVVVTDVLIKGNKSLRSFYISQSFSVSLQAQRERLCEDIVIWQPSESQEERSQRRSNPLEP